MTLVETVAGTAAMGILTLAVMVTAVGIVREEHHAEARAEGIFQLRRTARRIVTEVRFRQGLITPETKDEACPTWVNPVGDPANNFIGSSSSDGEKHYYCSDHDNQVLYYRIETAEPEILARGIRAEFLGGGRLLKVRLVGIDALGQEQIIQTSAALRG